MLNCLTAEKMALEIQGYIRGEYIHLQTWWTQKILHRYHVVSLL